MHPPARMDAVGGLTDVQNTLWELQGEIVRLELRRELLAEVRAHRLAEIREAYGLNQTEVSQQLGISQSRVSRIEHGELDRSEIGTGRACVEALGGEIEIVARSGDERLTVS